MISPAAEDSIENQRIKNIFIQSTYPTEGIFGLNMYVRGRPYTITIDDYLPVYNGGLIFEAADSGDHNIWSALLEKAFAKVVGNYEGVNDGWQVESMRYFTGAPSYQY